MPGASFRERDALFLPVFGLRRMLAPEWLLLGRKRHTGLHERQRNDQMED
jgi:hypothetical protein